MMKLYTTIIRNNIAQNNCIGKKKSQSNYAELKKTKNQRL